MMSHCYFMHEKKSRVRVAFGFALDFQNNLIVRLFLTKLLKVLNALLLTLTNCNKSLLTGMWSGAALPFQFDNSGENFSIELILMIMILGFVLEINLLKINSFKCTNLAKYKKKYTAPSTIIGTLVMCSCACNNFFFQKKYSLTTQEKGKTQP